MPIRKKSGNLSYAPRIYIYIYVCVCVCVRAHKYASTYMYLCTLRFCELMQKIRHDYVDAPPSLQSTASVLFSLAFPSSQINVILASRKADVWIQKPETINYKKREFKANWNLKDKRVIKTTDWLPSKSSS